MIMHLMTHLLILPLLALQAVQAAEPDACETAVDLRATSMAGVPILHQGDSYLCAQHTAVGLMQAYLQSKEMKGQAIASPGALAIEAAARSKFPMWFPVQNTTDPLSKKPLRWGGNICPLIAYARQNEACNDPFLQDQTEAMGPQVQATFQSLYNTLRENRLQPKKTRRLKGLEIAEKLRAILLSGYPIREPRDVPTTEQIQTVIQEKREPYEIIQAIALQGCAKNRTSGLSTLPTCSTSLPGGSESSQSAAIANISGLLAKKSALPVPFAFCYQVFNEGLSYKDRYLWSTDCGAHWSLIIGMKKIQNQCYFLVRNSYGKSETYSKDWIVDQGDVWIRADTLLRATTVVEWLSN